MKITLKTPLFSEARDQTYSVFVEANGTILALVLPAICIIRYEVKLYDRYSLHNGVTGT
jgi:hypothetical protein